MVFRSVALVLKHNSIHVSLTPQVYKQAKSRIKVEAFLIHVKPMVAILSLLFHSRLRKESHEDLILVKCLPEAM